MNRTLNHALQRTAPALTPGYRQLSLRDRSNIRFSE